MSHEDERDFYCKCEHFRQGLFSKNHYATFNGGFRAAEICDSIFIVWFFATGTAVHITPAVLLFPLLVLIMGMLGLGLGMIISSLTTKYRDLRFLLQFGIQLAMYATPIIYPVSSVPEKYRWLIFSNPMTAIVETFRYGFLGSGALNIMTLIYSGAVSLFILVIGTIIFNRVERTFMDTV